MTEHPSPSYPDRLKDAHKRNEDAMRTIGTRLAVMLAVITLTAMLAVGLTLGALSIYYGSLCPSEDSCVADYFNGRWHIERDTP